MLNHKFMNVFLLTCFLTTPVWAEEIPKAKGEISAEVIKTSVSDEVQGVQEDKTAESVSNLDPNLQKESAAKKNNGTQKVTEPKIEVTEEVSSEIENKPILALKNKRLPKVSASPLLMLKNMDKFKVCSLGHNYNISNYEFIKDQQFEQNITVIKYKSQEEDSRYNCEVAILSEAQQNVALKCWKGIKTNINLSVFKLGYYVDDSFLFIQENKSRLVLVKPIEHGTSNTCPKNYLPISKAKEKEAQANGLAGLTF